MSPSKTAASVLLAAILAVSLQAQVVKTYPYISITPTAPVANRDSVMLSLALGQASNACMAPTFTGATFTIVMLPTGGLVPVYSVSLSYTTVPVPPNKMCPMIYAPVDYGPSYALGKLAFGNYAVFDQNTGKQVGTFSVVNAQQGSNDTVTVTPQRPTTKDSLHFDLFNANFNCCTQYIQKSASVSDSMITLSYQYLDTQRCACLVAGSHTSFACGPQKAGKYAIYKAEQAYCAGPICPAGPILLKRVGEVTVSVPASTERGTMTNSHGAASPVAVVNSGAGSRLKISLERAQRVTVTVFSINGGFQATPLENRYLSQGVHNLNCTGFVKSPGIVIVRCRGETFSASEILDVKK